MDKEARILHGLRRLIKNPSGKVGEWLGGHADSALGAIAKAKGNAPKAAWHKEVRPVSRVSKVVGRDIPGLAAVGPMEGISQLGMPGIPLFHTTSAAASAASRAVRGKMTPFQMYKKMKTHPKLGIEGQRASTARDPGVTSRIRSRGRSLRGALGAGGVGAAAYLNKESAAAFAKELIRLSRL